MDKKVGPAYWMNLRSIDWLIEPELDRLIVPSLDWLIGQALDWLIVPLLDWLIGQVLDWLIVLSLDWLIDSVLDDKFFLNSENEAVKHFRSSHCWLNIPQSFPMGYWRETNRDTVNHARHAISEWKLQVDWLIEGPLQGLPARRLCTNGARRPWRIRGTLDGFEYERWVVVPVLRGRHAGNSLAVRRRWSRRISPTVAPLTGSGLILREMSSRKSLRLLRNRAPSRGGRWVIWAGQRALPPAMSGFVRSAAWVLLATVEFLAAAPVFSRLLCKKRSSED